MVGAKGYEKEREAVSEDEFELYMQLEKRGWKCGVHDPDFAEPLEGRLHLEKGLRYSLRLDCEDESLNYSKPLHLVRAEPRDAIHGGCGLALLDIGATPGGSEGIRVVIADSIEERDCLARVIERVQHEPRSFRRAKKAMLGCLPAGACGSSGCASVPCGRPKRRPHSSPPAAEGSGAREPSFAPSPTSRSRSVGRDHASSVSGLEEAREYVRLEWGKVRAMRSKKTSANQLPAFLNRSATSVGAGDPPRTGDVLGSEHSGLLLARLLGPDDTPQDGGRGSERGSAATAVVRTGSDHDNWQRNAADLFTGFNEAASFIDFWSVMEQMLLVDILVVEPRLHKYFRNGSFTGMTKVEWDWFFVEVQDDARDVVEAAASQLARMATPSIGQNGKLTLFGLSRYLCSPVNSFLDPGRCRQHCDMQRPLSDYWIATAHHIHADTPPRLAAGEGDREPQSEGMSLAPSEASDGRGALYSTILSGCRCLGLALDIARGELQVLLQQDRVPLSEVLRFVEEQAFQKNPFPLILVFHLARLAPADCASVPEALTSCLGERLWKASAAGGAAPSPEEARGKVIVVLAPAARGLDPGLEPEPPPALRAPPQGGAGAGADSRREVLHVWEDLAKRCTVWPARRLDPELSRHAPFSLVPSDELRAMLKMHHDELVEYHRGSLTLAFPLATRNAPANFNPAIAWAAGVQMAAVTACCGCSTDGACLANAGRFSQDNGGCGYVLKPPELRSSVSEHPPRLEGGQVSSSDLTDRTQLRLDLRVLAARAVPGADGTALASGPTALAVSIWGAPADCARHVYRPARPNGVVITWPEAAPAADGSLPKPLAFAVSSPSTAVLVMELLDLDSRLGGPRRLAFFAAPVDALRHGLRWAPLWTTSPGGEARPARCGPLSGLLVSAIIKKEHHRPRSPERPR